MKRAFTLAEVLITLGIIGVVAAMTIPTLMTEINHIKLKSQFKEAYSLLAQAVRMYNEDDERIEYKPNTNNLIYKSFIKYFKGATDCGDTGSNRGGELCITRIDAEGNVNKDSAYKNYAKNTDFITTSVLDDGQFFLSNNMLIMFDHNLKNPIISIDLNGKAAKPNFWGHDVFTFELQESAKEGGYEVIPMGAPTSIYKDTNKYCSRTSKNTMNGIACTYYAMTDSEYFKNLP